MQLPPNVREAARTFAARTGIDEPSALSFTAEAWSTYEDPLWKTVAFRRCVDQRRHESGQDVEDHRPLVVLDEPTLGGADRNDPAPKDPALTRIELRDELASAIGGLSDADLAAVARFYWLGISPGVNTPAAVKLARAMRHARKLR